MEPEELPAETTNSFDSVITKRQGLGPVVSQVLALFGERAGHE
jgi:hypothetical protein